MKRIIKITTVAFLVCGGSYTLYSSQNQCELSDLALANIEALASGNIHDGCESKPDFVCYDYFVSPGAPGTSGNLEDSGSGAPPPTISGEAYLDQVNYYEFISD